MDVTNDKSYNEWYQMTDAALLKRIGHFVRHHRLNQNISQDEASTQAGISRSTLSLLERGEKVTLGTLLQVLRVLDLLHVMDVFEVQNEISPVAYAKAQKKIRKRSSGTSQVNEPEDLGW